MCALNSVGFVVAAGATGMRQIRVRDQITGMRPIRVRDQIANSAQIAARFPKENMHFKGVSKKKVFQIVFHIPQILHIDERRI